MFANTIRANMFMKTMVNFILRMIAKISTIDSVLMKNLTTYLSDKN